MKTSFSRLFGENYVIIKKLSVPRNVKMNKLSQGSWGGGRGAPYKPGGSTVKLTNGPFLSLKAK